jgi:hypothetical protein
MRSPLRPLASDINFGLFGLLQAGLSPVRRTGHSPEHAFVHCKLITWAGKKILEVAFIASHCKPEQHSTMPLTALGVCSMSVNLAICLQHTNQNPPEVQLSHGWVKVRAWEPSLQ